MEANAGHREVTQNSVPWGRKELWELRGFHAPPAGLVTPFPLAFGVRAVATALGGACGPIQNSLWHGSVKSQFHQGPNSISRGNTPSKQVFGEENGHPRHISSLRFGQRSGQSGRCSGKLHATAKIFLSNFCCTPNNFVPRDQKNKSLVRRISFSSASRLKKKF